jgi:DNA-binding transcriptional ArsR family regulator
MDADLEAAASCLARFDSLGALRLVGLRDDPEALALRGVALAQLGEDSTAHGLLRRAERAFLRSDPVMHARIVAARGEIALAARDLELAGRLLEAAEAALGADRTNRTYVRFLRVRRLLLLGRVDEARALAAIDIRGAPPRLRALVELLRADIAARRLRVLEADAAIARARMAARAAELPPLAEQVERLAAEVAAPVARIVRSGQVAPATLAEIASLERERGLVVDACRRELRLARVTVSLATRPVLFALAEALAEAAPGGQSRALLIERAFGARRTTESLRARLRVEIGRLRRTLEPFGPLAIESTTDGFALRWTASSGGTVASARGEVSPRVVVVLPPADGEASLLLALLRGGEAWSSSALASATGLGQRAVQRALAELKDAGKIDTHGAGRNRRWVARPPDGFATTLLLLTRPGPR